MKTLKIKNEFEAASAPSGSKLAGPLRLSVVAVGALLMCAVVSCKKDDSGEHSSVCEVRSFHATSEGQASDDKTVLDSVYVNWEEGDEAAVQGSDAGQVPVMYVASVGGSAITEYNSVGGSGASGSPFYAIYPYTAAVGNCDTEKGEWNVTLPKFQVASETGTFVSGANVMAAKSFSTGLAFKNLCGVLKLKLKGETDITVKSIQVVSKTSTEKLWGNGHVTFKEGTNESRHTLEGLDGDNGVCLVYPNGIVLTNDEVEFDLVIPGNSLKGGFDLEVYCEYGNNGDGGKRKGVFFTGTTNGGEAMIEQNRITRMSTLIIKKDFISEGVLPGRFSLAEGQQFHFSQGNLQATFVGPTKTDYNWSFAKKQSDCIWDTSPGNVTIAEDGTNEVGAIVDLFCWSTESTNYGIDISTEQEHYSGELVDWGTVVPQNGPARQWRMLERWDYVILERNSNWTRFALGRLNSSGGIILFPDGTGNRICGYEIQNINDSGGNSADNTFDDETWAPIEACGAVFLPRGGYREGNRIPWGNYLGYSTMRPNKGIYIFSGYFVPEYSMPIQLGHSVRLVCP